jgi:hypothetical protein
LDARGLQRALAHQPSNKLGLEFELDHNVPKRRWAFESDEIVGIWTQCGFGDFANWDLAIQHVFLGLVLHLDLYQVQVLQHNSNKHDDDGDSVALRYVLAPMQYHKNELSRWQTYAISQNQEAWAKLVGTQKTRVVNDLALG